MRNNTTRPPAGANNVPSHVVYTSSANMAYSNREGARSSSALPADTSRDTRIVTRRDPSVSNGSLSAPNLGSSLNQETAKPSFRPRSLYIGDLHEDVGEQVLMELFQEYGPVQSIRICRDMITRVSLGYGYVNFMNVDDAERAMEDLNFHCSPKTKNKAIRISWKQRDPSVRQSGRGNIFVKGLDENVTNRELFDIFKQFGRIMSSKVAMDTDGNSLGHGFVHFESPDAAKKAIDELNGKMLFSTQVFVGPFIPKAERTSSSKDSFTNVFVKDIDERRLTDHNLRGLFGSYGDITSVHVPQRADGTPKGFAFVNFTSPEDAKLAVADMDGKELDGRIVYVGRAQRRSERDAELLTIHERLRREEEINREGRNLYVENLSLEVNEEDLKRHFGAFGTIESCIVIRDHAKTSRGFGFVCFQKINDAARAKIVLNGTEMGASRNVIHVAMAHCKGNRRSTNRPPAPAQPSAAMSTGPSNPGIGVGFYGGHQQIPEAHVRTAPARTEESRNNLVFTSGNLPMSNQPNMVANRMRAGGHSNTDDAFGRPHPVTSIQQIFEGEPVSEATPEDRKQVLGELLYRKVTAYNTGRPGKITGMLLELDVAEIVQMLETPSALDRRVRQAVDILLRANAALYPYRR